jgi:chromosome segregation protein
MTTAPHALAREPNLQTGATPGPIAATPPGAADGLVLQRLTMVGFKSFADKTTFTFDEPITGVVGPNGCGKSNLVDAIKWVLGERSSKTLRGKEMIDVIFAGSAGRKPAGMASVTLTFSNPVNSGDANGATPGGADDGESRPAATALEEAPPAPAEPADDSGPPTPGEPEETILADRRRVRRPLPIDAEEVAVERQLYRDGTSKYLINGKRARLRDIRDLFLDTGIGADAYSIIEQGKVDAMLLASPQERRTIFEEAAGVAKYKVRRIEAQRKLDRTEANLVRTREQLESTERRLKTVRTQAAKARRFQELDDESRALKLAVAFQQYDEARLSLEGLTSQLQRLSGERDATQRAVTEHESEKREADAARAGIEAELRRTEQARADAVHTAAQAEQRAAMATRSIEEADRAIETETARKESAEAAAQALASDADDAKQSLAAIAERLADAERSLESLNAERSEAVQRSAEARRSLSESRATLEKIERDRARLSAEADARGREHEQLAGRATKLVARADALESAVRELDASIEETARAVSRAEDRVERAGARAAELDRRAGGLNSDRSAQLDALNALERELAGADAKRGTLAELVRARAGLGDAAREALERRDAGEGFAGVIAPLAELVEVDAEHAPTVEAALGDLLDALVVRTPSDVPTREELDGLPGRVRLAVLSDQTLAPMGMDDSTRGLLAPRVRLVRSLVRARAGAPAETGGLLDRVLGGCVAVGDLDAAQMLRASGMTRARFVTTAGETLDQDGTMTVGPASATGETGILTRAAELTALETRVAELTARADTERVALVATDERLGRVQAERADVERELADARSVHAKAASKLEREGNERSRTERDLAGVREESGELDTQSAAIAERIADLTERARKLDGLAAEHAQAVREHEASAVDAEGAAERANDALAKARVEVGKLGEQAAAGRREFRRLESEAEAALRRVGEHEQHVAEARERRDRHAETVRTARDDRARLDAEAESLQKTTSEFAERLVGATDRCESVGTRLGQARERARLVERDWNAIEASRRVEETKREHLEERAMEDARVDLARDYLDYRAVVAPGDVAPVDIPDAQARINVLRTEIKKLGNVNIDAIAEEDLLADKNEELVAALADIDEARATLVELIEKLNIASKARFGEVFGKIQANFGGQDGMFRKLFGGGRAEVRLMPLVKDVDGQKVQTDEVDLLESGIEVIAKPPGKEPRSISQLSGGEKTLTAVALLMSIFRSKPSCFCVLDEVDAALDEANVARFGGVVNEFTSFSRFIVITHNKRTMQVCDHLYGITQRERGVSSRVSVRFDQVGADGTVKADARSGEHQRDEVNEPKPSATPPERPKPSGALRRALAGMRQDSEPVAVDAGTPVESDVESPA